MDRQMNETDVREEVATPLLAKLGYARGTSNDILRELAIAYDRFYLGRKKPNDAPLRGRADYVLSVLGAGRWTLEIKAPSEDITRDAIEQAISYARHPEVSGSYAAVLNGKRFVLFHHSQTSSDAPILDLVVNTVDDLAEKLRGILSPTAIRRDCTPPVVDLAKPLSDGLRSSAAILGGSISYINFQWEANFSMPNEAIAPLNDAVRIMTGFRADVTGGRVWRDDSSRVRAKINWSLPRTEMMQFAVDKHLMDVEYISLDEEVSKSEDHPTVFDFVGSLSVSKGEKLYNLTEWKSEVAGIETAITYRGQAVGYIRDDNFIGAFQSEMECQYPALPDFRLTFNSLGSFAVKVDTR